MLGDCGRERGECRIAVRRVGELCDHTAIVVLPDDSIARVKYVRDAMDGSKTCVKSWRVGARTLVGGAIRVLHRSHPVTLAFFRLGMIDAGDAAFYMLAQIAGAIAGVLLAGALLGPALAAREVQFAVTVPGPAGALVAFAAELAISFVLMTAVLHVTNNPRLHPFTGLVAGALVATYILVEAPLSGMSMNPARTLGSAIPAGVWNAIWIYLVAPPLAMIAAADLYVRRSNHRVLSGKLLHDPEERCIFKCCTPAIESE